MDVNVHTTDSFKMEVQQWFFYESTDENNLNNLIEENKKLKTKKFRMYLLTFYILIYFQNT